MLPQKSKFDEYSKMGLVRNQTHDNLPLTIYNYTELTQFDRLWNGVTKMARGIVFDDKGRCVVRCMPKFFNQDEPNAMDGIDLTKAPTIYNKLDGSMIQIVNDKQYGLIVTSKGSFKSKQVMWANEIIERDNLSQYIKQGYAYVFELIHPENQIVLNYGNEKELYLLTVIDIETGKELDIYNKQFDNFKRVQIITDIDKHMSELVEGVVVKTGNHRYKLKTDEYLRLHRIVTNFTPKRVWEALSSGQVIERQNIPEEFISWLDETENNLKAKFNTIKEQALKSYEETKNLTDKELGMSDNQYKHFIFLLRKNNSIDNKIWRMIKPKEEIGDSNQTR